FEQGIEDQFGLNQSKMNAGNNWRTKFSNEALYEECISQLKNLFGIKYGQQLQLNELLEYDKPNDVSFIDVTTNRRLITLNRQIESSELNVRIQKAAFMPSISMTTYNGRQLNKEEFGLDIGEGTWTDYSYVSATISIPIFTGFSRNNQVKIANRELSLAKLNYETELRNSELADMLLLSDYNHGVETLEQSQVTFNLAKENQQIAFVRYEEGLITLDQYLNAVEDRLLSENAYLNDLSMLYSHYSTIISRTSFQ
ncbi:MAG: TolC family protein, partial [Balneolales bacterium]|nr:TolC family protein [Balneolales bacterium]